MRFVAVSLLLVFAVGMVGCGSRPGISDESLKARGRTKVELPDWYVNIPQDSMYHYARGTSIEGTMGDAENNAEMDGSSAVASWVMQEVNTTGTIMRKQLGDDNPLHASWDRVVSMVAAEKESGIEPSPGHLAVYETDDGKTEVLLLMRVSREDVFKRLKDAATQESEAYEYLIQQGLLKDFEERIRDYKNDR